MHIVPINQRIELTLYQILILPATAQVTVRTCVWWSKVRIQRGGNSQRPGECWGDGKPRHKSVYFRVVELLRYYSSRNCLRTLRGAVQGEDLRFRVFEFTAGKRGFMPTSFQPLSFFF